MKLENNPVFGLFFDFVLIVGSLACLYTFCDYSLLSNSEAYSLFWDSISPDSYLEFILIAVSLGFVFCFLFTLFILGYFAVWLIYRFSLQLIYRKPCRVYPAEEKTFQLR